MKILGIIPARYGSSRFPGKPLADILGMPMIARVYNQAKKCLLLDELVVATDDDRIAACIRSINGNVVMTPEPLNSGTERCQAAISAISDSSSFDAVINIQGDEPFIDPEQISQVATCFRSEEVQIATLVRKISNSEDLYNPNIVKVVFDLNKRALYFSRHPIPYNRNEEPLSWVATTGYYKHIGIYGYRTKTLNAITKLPAFDPEKAESLEQLRWMGNGYPIHVQITDYESIAVDTPDDLLKLMNKF